jgi:hypothetical protein
MVVTLNTFIRVAAAVDGVALALASFWLGSDFLRTGSLMSQSTQDRGIVADR